MTGMSTFAWTLTCGDRGQKGLFFAAVPCPVGYVFVGGKPASGQGASGAGRVGKCARRHVLLRPRAGLRGDVPWLGEPSVDFELGDSLVLHPPARSKGEKVALREHVFKPDCAKRALLSRRRALGPHFFSHWRATLTCSTFLSAFSAFSFRFWRRWPLPSSMLATAEGDWGRENRQSLLKLPFRS